MRLLKNNGIANWMRQVSVLGYLFIHVLQLLAENDAYKNYYLVDSLNCDKFRLRKKKQLLILIVGIFAPIVCSNAQEIEFTEEEKAWIEAHPVINHGYEPNWPPFESYNEKDSTYTGISEDYMKIIEEKTGIDMRPIPNVKWKDVINQLENGEICFTSSCVITEERKKYLKFPVPYLSLPLVIVTKNDYEFVSSLNDLKGKKVAIPSGYYTAELLERDFPKINIVTVLGVDTALDSVILGKADAFVGNLAVVNYSLKKEKYFKLKIAAPTKYLKSEVSFGVSKDWPELVSIINKVYKSISIEKHNEIKQKRLKQEPPNVISLKKIRKYAEVTFLMVLMIMGIILYWNRILNKEIVKRKKAEEKIEDSLIKLENQNREKTAMLNAVQNRVKKSLKVVHGLLKRESTGIDDDKVLEAVEEAQNRVLYMAIFHEKIFQSGKLTHMNIKEVIDLIIKDLTRAYAKGNKVKFDVDVKDVAIEVKTLVPLGLIVNELITNSLKYAFQNQDRGEIKVQIKSIDHKCYEMIVGDNGIGRKEETENSGIGTKLIEIFTKQLNGTLERLDQPGTVYRLVFNTIDYKESELDIEKTSHLEVSNDKILAQEIILDDDDCKFILLKTKYK